MATYRQTRPIEGRDNESGRGLLSDHSSSLPHRKGGQNRATGAGGNHLLIAEKTPQEGFAFQGLESYYFFNYKENKPHLAVRSPVERKRLTEMEKIDRSGRGGVH